MSVVRREAGSAPSGFSDQEREAVYRVIQARRDIRKFSPEPVPEPVLMRVLEAAHRAPSVGFMQPWNFILIRSRPTRERIRESFEKTNAAELAKLSADARRDLYANLKLEGILESPLNIAVTCDESRGGSFVLGRAPMPETSLYSACLAVENMWLAARAEGVGVGWVSILEPSLVASILGLPEPVRLVAYLCVGYPVEFRPRPMLEESGWRARLPLDELIFEETWGRPRDASADT